MVRTNFLMTAPLLMASFCSAQEKPNVVLILVDDIKIPLTHVVDLDSEKLPDMNQMEW